MSILVFVKVVSYLYGWLVYPLCVDNYVDESREVIRMFVPVIIMEGFDQDNNEIVIITSPTTFIVGGMARLAKYTMIHHISTGGNTRPQAMTIVLLGSIHSLCLLDRTIGRMLNRGQLSMLLLSYNFMLFV